MPSVFLGQDRLGGRYTEWNQLSQPKALLTLKRLHRKDKKGGYRVGDRESLLVNIGRSPHPPFSLIAGAITACYKEFVWQSHQ